VSNECVIDTTVLQKANAPLIREPRETSLFVRRLRLLRDIQRGQRTVLISNRLFAEYQSQVSEPRNDFVVTFLALVAAPDSSAGRCLSNWAAWPGRQREKARKCKFPKHDDHLLRTAICPSGSTIITEETKLIDTDACIYRRFNVHVRYLPQV